MGVLGFAAPALLGALLILPGIWWLLRATPPAPRREAFGGMAFLRGLVDSRAEPARTPWPILALRLLAAALLIIGLAGPQLNAPEAGASGPLLIVLDDGWPSASDWRAAQEAVQREADRPGADTREAWLLFTASDEPTLSGPLTLVEAARAVDEAQPMARLPNYEGASLAVQDAPRTTDVLFVTGAGMPDTAGRATLLRALSAKGQLTVFRRAGAETTAIVALRANGASLLADLVRTGGAGARGGALRVTARDGRVLTDADFIFEAGQSTATAEIVLPLTLRNEAARLSVLSERSAGATWLVDASARRVRAGLVTDGTADSLLTSNTYLSEALEPLALVERGAPEALARPDTDVVILDDVGTLRRDAERTLIEWVRAGGLLLRFAGPDTANAEDTQNDTFPAPLRTGGRSFGGALTWTDPQPLAGFAEDSPLGGLAVPADVAVRRQVLLRQEAGAEVWAYLADGTPLVTARTVGEGLVVLIHVTASPTWSDLPISGAFPAMLRRILTAARTSALSDEAVGPQAVISLLDGYGGLYEPTGAVPPATRAALAASDVAPGLYGARDAALSVNAYEGSPALVSPTRGLPAGTRVAGPSGAALRRLGPPLVAAALILLTLDALLLTVLSRRKMPASVVAAAAVLLVCPDADAQPRPPLSKQAVEAAELTRFAYVLTGDARQDRLSRAGLCGLTREAIRRSALEPGEPAGVNPARDELSVYPLLYWPIVPGTEMPDEALFAIEDYMAGGGLVLIDTMDGERAGGSRAQQDRLRALLRRMDTPPLEPLEPGNVLTLSFYRLDALHGRNSGGTVWVEAEAARRESTDGVPTLVIGGRDWASAWAVDDGGVPLRSPGPGGERQREFAYRAGLNLAMVALTGSYKTDQVHVSEFLERLGEEDL